MTPYRTRVATQRETIGAACVSSPQALGGPQTVEPSLSRFWLSRCGPAIGLLDRAVVFAVMATEELVCRADGFAGLRFWRDLERLAVQNGHEDHPFYLVGETKFLNRYHLMCPRCSATIVTVTVVAAQKLLPADAGSAPP